MGLPRWLSGEESVCQAEGAGSILGWKDALKKEMATHSNILAWKIPWKEEPDRLQYTGSQRVGHKATNTHTQNSSTFCLILRLIIFVLEWSVL